MKVIQVGIGGMGNTWLRCVLESSEVEYAGFVEIDARIARAQVEKYGLDASLIFPSLEAALQAVKADGVIVVTPPRFHRDVSIAALEAGIPVLSEKPLADTPEAARDIVRVSNDTGVLHVVAQNYRYRAPIQTLKRVLESGSLGTVASATVEFFRGPHFGGFREEMPYPLITDMSIHHFDMMRFLLESDPVTIFGRSWNPPWSWFKGDAAASLILDFANQVVVTYDGSWCSNGGETSWNANWWFECENGVVLLRDDQVYTRVSGEESALVPTIRMEHESQAYLLHEFYLAVTEGRTPVTTCQDNAKSSGIVFDALRSFQSGLPVRCSGGQV